MLCLAICRLTAVKYVRNCRYSIFTFKYFFCDMSIFSSAPSLRFLNIYLSWDLYIDSDNDTYEEGNTTCKITYHIQYKLNYNSKEKLIAASISINIVHSQPCCEIIFDSSVRTDFDIAT